MTLADHIVILKDGMIMQQGKPVSVYEKPVSRFVGEFIGSPKMNIITASVSSEGGSVKFHNDGFELSVSDCEMADGQTIEVGIRPEHLIPCDKEDALITARIDVLEPLGSDTHAICLVGKQELTARLDPSLPVNTGDTLILASRS